MLRKQTCSGRVRSNASFPRRETVSTVCITDSRTQHRVFGIVIGITNFGAPFRVRFESVRVYGHSYLMYVYRVVTTCVVYGQTFQPFLIYTHYTLLCDNDSWNCIRKTRPDAVRVSFRDFSNAVTFNRFCVSSAYARDVNVLYFSLAIKLNIVRKTFNVGLKNLTRWSNFTIFNFNPFLLKFI